jgi:ABC-type spermidine/putrescine transport system permease subunit II
LAFLFSFDEFTVTRFLTGITVETLPVKFYGAAQQNLNPELAAVGSLIVCGLLVICAVAAVLMRLVRARTYQGKEAR